MDDSKINFSHDPENVLNAFLSASRNFFLTASISVGLLGVRQSMKTARYKQDRIFIMALFTMFFSIIYGLKTSLDFSDYLNHLSTKSPFKNTFLVKNHAKKWRGWVYLNLLFMIPLLMGILVGFYRLFKMLHK